MAAKLAPRTHLRLVQPDERGVRPVTRGDCASVPRPCPWTECRYNLVHTRERRAKNSRTPLDDSMTCVLDVADDGGANLDTVGRALGVTRERARQIEEVALRKLGLRPGELAEWDEGGGVPGHGRAASRAVHESGRLHDDRAFRASLRGVEAAGRDDDDPEVSFFHNSDADAATIDDVERADRVVTAAVWRMFVRASNGRGIDARSRQSKQASAALQERGSAFNVPPPGARRDDDEC